MANLSWLSSIDLARMVIQKMHTTMVSSDEPASFLMETLPSLAKLATTFPAQLTDDTINLLLGTLHSSGPALVGGSYPHTRDLYRGISDRRTRVCGRYRRSESAVACPNPSCVWRSRRESDRSYRLMRRAGSPRRPVIVRSTINVDFTSDSAFSLVVRQQLS